MTFTSSPYFYFLCIVLGLYWTVRGKTLQNAVLLAASYVFYGWIHPWFCGLLLFSTTVDYFVGLGIGRYPARKKAILLVSIVSNLGLLGIFKYLGFFVESTEALLRSVGWEVSPVTLKIVLPVGLSFYTFQALSYTIDVYRGVLAPRKNALDYFLFVAFFPQLVSGPIERAAHMLPQFERERRWEWRLFAEAWPLLVRGFLKKMVIADNVAVCVDKVFMLDRPPGLLLAVGTLAFSLQIYADFSAYTDMARGSARLLGFELVENFAAPYSAISPSDFWRRWHISLSSWVRDYLYIPLGGARTGGTWSFAGVLAVTMGLAGLWHGASWHFIAWGLFHGAVLFVYHKMGKGGRWRPGTPGGTVWAWACMFCITQVGWLLFRTPNLLWLGQALRYGTFDWSRSCVSVALTILGLVGFYALPLAGLSVLERRVSPDRVWIRAFAYGIVISLILCLGSAGGRDFIYFVF